MKKSIIILSMLIAVLSFAGCGGGEPVEEAAPEPEPVVPLTAEELEQVQVLVEDNICTECHGENLEGTETGPALAAVRQYWTKDLLIKYIYNPEFFMVSHPEVKRRNPGFDIDMPPYTDLSEDERRLLARWVLQQSE
ncbi:MAG: cytochrome c [Acidobacteria bacterium]|uniref:Cytochrome c n=1 Tax=Candidatus Polarisedimenticola svalbardensis TaxID=2886004 RepID=A0A8J7C2V4_9BACT|nr:cytochrome c [Candidatus Polarisedimenticola svalbardensis]